MAQAVLAERVGTTVKGVRGPDGGEAKITRSVQMKEVFPASGTELVLDFYTDEHGQCACRLQRKMGGKTRDTGCWTLSAIENRDCKGLTGFKEFAEKLGLKGYQLANNITGWKPKG